MERLTVVFYEVEHEGDLEPILEDISRCGGKVLSSSINDEAETARVTFEVANKKAFREAFMKTESAGWLD